MRTLLALLLALLVSGCSHQMVLETSMPEAEANEVLAALQDAGIGAEKIAGKEGMVGVAIDAAQMGHAVDLLRAKGLPRPPHAGLGQVFKKDGLISSPLEERARYLYALAEELDATLSEIDGVIVARVHVVLPDRGSEGDPDLPSSAAVFIKYQDGYNLDSLQSQIRRLVTNSIPGLSPDRVSIVLFDGQSPTFKPQQAVARSTSPLLIVALVLVAMLALAGGGYFAWRKLRPSATPTAANAQPD